MGTKEENLASAVFRLSPGKTAYMDHPHIQRSANLCAQDMARVFGFAPETPAVRLSLHEAPGPGRVGMEFACGEDVDNGETVFWAELITGACFELTGRLVDRYIPQFDHVYYVECEALEDGDI